MTSSPTHPNNNVYSPLATTPHRRIINHPGVSYGLVPPLLNFWSRKQFKVCYVRQTKNDLTGEHSCIMLRELNRIGDSNSRDPNAPVQVGGEG